jgi:ABC-2 type transport system permease protein
MWAIIVKEFRQMRRDRRLLALMILIPLLLLVVFGYAARFDVTSVQAKVVGPQAAQVAAHLPPLLHVSGIQADAGRADAIGYLRRGDYATVVVTGPGQVSPEILVDGVDLFDAQAVLKTVAQERIPARVTVLFNPELNTSSVMIPGIIGILLVFVGTLATALGVVRERQSATLEQLAVMPFRPWDIFVGKVAPYFLIAAADAAIVTVIGLAVFHVPFRGSLPVFVLGALLFLFVTLSTGVLISSVSETQGQAIQLTMITLLPQILLSGFVFPVASMAAGVRWIAYVLPLKYFLDISRA